MKDTDIMEFVGQTMKELAVEYDIPEPFIMQLIALMQKFPDVEQRGKKTDLRNSLETIINNLKKQGLLDRYAI